MKKTIFLLLAALLLVACSNQSQEIDELKKEIAALKDQLNTTATTDPNGETQTPNEETTTPSEQNKPSEETPSQPSQSTTPSQPSQSTTPSQPSQSTTPSQPSQSTTPSQPSTSEGLTRVQQQLSQITSEVDQYIRDAESAISNPSNINTYFNLKQTDQQLEQRLDVLENELEGLYSRQLITLDQYRSTERSIEYQEDRMDNLDDRLEYAFGIDD